MAKLISCGLYVVWLVDWSINWYASINFHRPWLKQNYSRNKHRMRSESFTSNTETDWNEVEIELSSLCQDFKKIKKPNQNSPQNMSYDLWLNIFPPSQGRSVNFSTWPSSWHTRGIRDDWSFVPRSNRWPMGLLTDTVEYLLFIVTSNRNWDISGRVIRDFTDWHFPSVVCRWCDWLYKQK